MIFKTKNSVYEIDKLGMMIRRVSGVNPPTDRFAPNGDWKPYSYISPIHIGLNVNVVWPNGSDYERTSRVEAISEKEQSLAA
jgi:hypothetical protein